MDLMEQRSLEMLWSMASQCVVNLDGCWVRLPQPVWKDGIVFPHAYGQEASNNLRNNSKDTCQQEYLSALKYIAWSQKFQNENSKKCYSVENGDHPMHLEAWFACLHLFRPPKKCQELPFGHSNISNAKTHQRPPGRYFSGRSYHGPLLWSQTPLLPWLCWSLCGSFPDGFPGWIFSQTVGGALGGGRGCLGGLGWLDWLDFSQDLQLIRTPCNKLGFWELLAMVFP